MLEVHPLFHGTYPVKGRDFFTQTIRIRTSKAPDSNHQYCCCLPTWFDFGLSWFHTYLSSSKRVLAILPFFDFLFLSPPPLSPFLIPYGPRKKKHLYFIVFTHLLSLLFLVCCVLCPLRRGEFQNVWRAQSSFFPSPRPRRWCAGLRGPWLI